MALTEYRIPNDVHQKADGTWTNYHIINGLPVNYADLDQELSDLMSQQSTGPLVSTILNTFGIPSDLSALGIDPSGELLGVDIKDVDTMSAIKMSLIEPFAKGLYNNPLEIVVTPEGNVSIIEIGSMSGGITDVYTSVVSTTFDVPEISVKVTGKKPRSKREVRDWVNLLYNVQEVNSEEGMSIEESEYSLAQALIWDTSQISSDCPLVTYKRHAVVTFKDPNLNAWAVNDGVESIYEVQSVWEKVVGWLWYLDPGPKVDRLTKVSVKQQSSVPYLLAGPKGIISAKAVPINNNSVNIGVLKKRDVWIGLQPQSTPENGCYEGLSYEISCDGTETIPISLPNSLRYTTVRNVQTDNLIRVSKIFVVGQELSMCKSFPKNDEVVANFLKSQSNEEKLELLKQTEVFVIANDLTPKAYVLEEGVDYGIGYNIDTGQLCIQVINNAHAYDWGTYGTDVSFKLHPNCILANEPNSDPGVGKGTLIPKEGAGYLVQQLWAQIDLNIPSVEIYDPHGRALEIAQDLRLEIAPIVVIDDPAPIAINGELVDQASAIVDSDPTTVQALQDSDYEIKMRALNGTQIFETNMATLSEQETINFSYRLKEILNRDKTLEISYVCGPNCNPQLGGTGLQGGVINNITYSYTDMGSYTISVTEGPYIPNTGLISGVTGGQYTKQVESITENGIVIQDEGNCLRYKVLVAGIGIVTAYSAISDIIRVGDEVVVKIYNVPMES
ncbi:MAG TPA: hypothetical protein VI911_07975 [Patescibacteria group bacterium]|nr:hypothetical protein [Patescibacteria group bacterium]